MSAEISKDVPKRREIAIDAGVMLPKVMLAGGSTLPTKVSTT